MKIVFATNNQNKLAEIRQLMPEGIEILSLKDINCLEDLPETSDTLEDNATQKAFYVFDNYRHNCFADDTGLEIVALDGRPGVYSARYAGTEANDADNVDKLLRNLEGILESKRQARFRCVLCLIDKDGGTYYFEGACEGYIGIKPRGESGFGYDPIFLPVGYESSFAELGESIKSELSHRAKAVIACKQFFKKKL